jgi:hypothetical protein
VLAGYNGGPFGMIAAAKEVAGKGPYTWETISTNRFVTHYKRLRGCVESVGRSKRARTAGGRIASSPGAGLSGAICERHAVIAALGRDIVGRQRAPGVRMPTDRHCDCACADFLNASARPARIAAIPRIVMGDSGLPRMMRSMIATTIGTR